MDGLPCRHFQGCVTSAGGQNIPCRPASLDGKLHHTHPVVIAAVDCDVGAAGAGDIALGKQAWANGVLLTGTGSQPTISLSDGVLSIS